MSLRYGTKAWIGLAAYILVAEVCAPAGETLSERVDDWLLTHPAKAFSYGAVTITAAHLLNIIPQRFDPIHRSFANNWWKHL